MNCCLIIFLVPLVAVVHGQKDEYCAINAENTMCLHSSEEYSKDCPEIVPTVMTDDDKQFIVDLHNELRSKVARGLEKRGNDGPQPKASNMLEITWDDELALMAETHVRQCVNDHDANRNVHRFEVGQNIGSSSTWPKNGVVNWTMPIRKWYDEVVDYDSSTVSQFTSGESATGKDIGHYTQVIWADTNRVGCGVINWKTSKGWYTFFYSCNYGPTGNVESEPVYLEGAPGSACPSGTSAKASGQCA